jgi:trehalose 6-phosphate phosphatase
MKGPTSVARSLFDHLSDVARVLGAASHVFLFLDFDGTLAPVVDDPDTASMSEKTREQLISLSQKPRFLLAIISGRPLSDLQQRVGLEGLFYAGNHGLEIAGPGLSFVQPAARERVPALRELSRSLETKLRDMPGARVDNKGLTATVHYRHARDEDREEIRRIVRESVASAGDLFRVSEGLKALEIRPQVNWNKGDAAQWILESSGRGDALPIYLGDHATDEDAFSALAAGITVRIGPTAETSAQYQLEYQEAVGEFLAWLVELDDCLSRQTAKPGEHSASAKQA